MRTSFIIRNEIWLIAIGVGLSFISNSFLLLNVFVWLLLAMYRKVKTGRFYKASILDLPILLIVIMAFLSLVISVNRTISNVQVLRLINGIVLYYSMVGCLDNKNRINKSLIALSLAGLGLIIISPIFVDWKFSRFVYLFNQLQNRLNIHVADTIHPNVLAGTLVVLLPISLTALFIRPKPIQVYQSAFYFLTSLLSLVMFVITESRGALLAALVIFLALFVLLWKRGWLTVVLSFSILGILFLIWGYRNVFEFLIASASLGGLPERIEVWSRAIFLIQDFPFTGIGFGLFGMVSDALYPFFLYQPGILTHSHNIFLQVALDIGIPGLVSWLACLILNMLLSWKLYRLGRGRSDSWIIYLGVVGIGTNLALITHGILDSVIWGMVKPAPLVWMLWGLIVASEKNYSISPMIKN